MHEHGKSYSSIVPEKLSNKSVPALAERAKGSGMTKGNLSQQNKCRTQCREGLQSALGRIRQAAAGDIARELVEKVRNSVSVDWTVR